MARGTLERKEERLLREVICKMIHLCDNIGGVDVKLKMGFNKEHATKHVHNALVLLVLDHRHATIT